jgi:hypothetical protein
MAASPFNENAGREGPASSKISISRAAEAFTPKR